MKNKSYSLNEVFTSSFGGRIIATIEMTILSSAVLLLICYVLLQTLDTEGLLLRYPTGTESLYGGITIVTMLLILIWKVSPPSLIIWRILTPNKNLIARFKEQKREELRKQMSTNEKKIKYLEEANAALEEQIMLLA